MRRSLVALALAGTAACSYIFELPATSEIPTPETDAGDAAPLPDAPPPYDAPPEIPFCASRTTPSLWCIDFDGVPPPELASLGTVQVTDAQLLLSNAVARSSPRSLLVNVRDGKSSTASIKHALGSDPEGLTLSFAQLVSAWDTTGAQLAEIELAGTNGTCFIRLEGGATAWSFTQVCEAGGVETARSTTDALVPIARGRWQRFALEVIFGPTPSVTLDIDGARTGAAGVAPLERAPASVTIGAKLVPIGNVTLFQDDVLVTSP